MLKYDPVGMYYYLQVWELWVGGGGGGVFVWKGAEKVDEEMKRCRDEERSTDGTGRIGRESEAAS